MLGIILRGAFIVGILGWYSTSVWKTIDGYFTDQFRSYLKEEHRRNPRANSDSLAGSIDKIATVVTTPGPEATALAPQREILEADRATESAVEFAENHSAVNANPTVVVGGSSENEFAFDRADTGTFLEAVEESGVESRKWSADQLESRTVVDRENRDLERQRNRDDDRSASRTSSERVRRKGIEDEDENPAVSRDISRKDRSPRKRQTKTIVFADRNAKSVGKGPAVSNDDFWEFDEDENGKGSTEGVLVSELPFKPRADIGDLERVTADEYCPLTVEDEAFCDETVKWP